ncbi:Uncharacterised protein [Sphingomonas paucimobilis]|nr:Uncharacterised protein [Sphingomonas paucimobilis]
MAFAHGREMVERAVAYGVEIVELPGDRLNLGLPDDPRQAYAAAKSTLAVVVAPPSKRKLQPIARAPTGGSIWRRGARHIAAIAISPGR